MNLLLYNNIINEIKIYINVEVREIWKQTIVMVIKIRDVDVKYGLEIFRVNNSHKTFNVQIYSYNIFNNGELILWTIRSVA